MDALDLTVSVFLPGGVTPSALSLSDDPLLIERPPGKSITLRYISNQPAAVGVWNTEQKQTDVSILAFWSEITERSPKLFTFCGFTLKKANIVLNLSEPLQSEYHLCYNTNA